MAWSLATSSLMTNGPEPTGFWVTCSAVCALVAVGQTIPSVPPAEQTRKGAGGVWSSATTSRPPLCGAGRAGLAAAAGEATLVAAPPAAVAAGRAVVAVAGAEVAVAGACDAHAASNGVSTKKRLQR